MWCTIASSWIMLSMLYMLYIAGSASSSLAPHAYSDGAGPSIDANASRRSMPLGSGMLAPPASGDGASPRSVTCGLRDPVHAFGAGYFTDSAVPHASGFGSRASHDGVVPLSDTALFGPSAPRIC